MNFKRLRIESNMTQSELSHLIGVTQQAICNYESGERTPPLKTFAKFCKALDLNPKQIAELVEEFRKN